MGRYISSSSAAIQIYIKIFWYRYRGRRAREKPEEGQIRGGWVRECAWWLSKDRRQCRFCEATTEKWWDMARYWQDRPSSRWHIRRRCGKI